MKRVLYVVVSILIFNFLINSVYADSFSLSLTGDSEFSYTSDLEVTIDSFSGFDNGLSGLDATLDYDNTKIAPVSVIGLNSFEVIFDKDKSDTFEAVSHEEVPIGTKLVTIKFKNISLVDGESTIVSLKNINGSNGLDDIEGTCISKTITYTAPEYQLGDMNKNGKIDLADIIYLLKKYLNNDASDEEKILGDLDSNGIIGLKDIIELLKLYLTS